MEESINQNILRNKTFVKLVLKRDMGLCRCCGFKGDEVHHILPLCLGGEDTLNNMITLCSECHRSAPNNKEDFKEYMTSSNGLKSIVSYFGSMPRKPFNINLSVKNTTNLLYGSLNGISLNRQIASLCGGDYYGTSIQTFQSNTLQFGCEDSNSEEWFSLQV